MIDWINSLAERGVFFTLKDGKLKTFSKNQTIDDDLLKEIKSRKTEILAYLQGKEHLLIDEPNSLEVPLVAVQKSYALSDAQRRIWILNELEADSVAYNIPSNIRLDETYEIKYFIKALKSVVARHEILRTIFKEESTGEIRQWIIPIKEFDFKIDHLQLSELGVSSKEYIEKDSNTAFDLSKGPLFRAAILKDNKGHNIFYFNMHHIISDGWSVEILKKDVFNFYEAYSNGKEPTIDPLDIQYKDYAAWQLQMLHTKDFDHHRKFWLEQFSGEIPLVDLPSSKQRPQFKTSNGERLTTMISKSTIQQLQTNAKNQGGSLFISLIASLNILIGKYANLNEVILGTLVSGRDHKQLENQIGFYVNTIALKNTICSSDNFSEHFDKSKSNVLNAYKHQSYPFNTLVDDLKLQRDTSRSALFDIMVVLQNNEKNDDEAITINETTSEKFTVSKVPSKVDMEIIFTEVGEALSFSITYNTDVYDHDMIRGFMDHYKNLLESIVNNAEVPISELEFMSPAEKQKILNSFNNFIEPFDNDVGVLDLIATQAKKTPDDTAIACGEKTISYRSLIEESNRFVNFLNDKGVVSKDVVLVSLDRSIDTMVAILGIMKAGATYVFIDPSCSKDRIDYIIKDTQSKLLLTKQGVLPNFEFEENFQLVQIDSEKDNYQKQSKTADFPNFKTDQIAYIIYTSGTTGKPKGVAISHFALANYIQYAAKTYTESKPLNFALCTSLSFDLTVTSMFTPLIQGGTIQILEPTSHYLQDIAAMVDLNFDIIKLTPSHLNAMLEFMELEKTSSKDKIFILGGEPLQKETVKRLKDCFDNRVTVWNEYGPTETTVGCISTKVEHLEYISSIPIGKPIANMQVYILDNAKALVPVGVVGEIYIEGPQLANGYINRSELTADSFVPNPFHDTEKMYKTGDLGKWNPDGTVEYLGRIDDQVKIRGYRIELAEIENVLLEQENVKEAAVLVTDENEGKSLQAYIVIDEAIDLKDIEHLLAKKLPKYMIPNSITVVEKMPKTNNEKLDKNALKELGVTHASSSKHVKPESSIEKKLSKIWSEILMKKTGDISTEIGFFELGGNSMRLLKLRSVIMEEFGSDFPIVTLFQKTTIKQQANYLLSLKQKPYTPKKAETGVIPTSRVIEENKSKDIAIVGMAIRAPGALNIKEFWNNLKSGHDSIQDFNEEELVEAGVPKRLIQNDNYVRSNLYLENKQYFDASFFGYLPDEVRIMDPQTRLFHEVVWEALENAGCIPEKYNGKIGLYGGGKSNLNWQIYSALAAEKMQVDAYTAAHLRDKDYTNALISHKLNLTGSVKSINTACSTSLVAIHDAIETLVSGVNDVVVAGGVSLKTDAQKGYLYKENMISSKDGRTRAFDAEASGTVGSEGSGAVVLKRLNEAIADGDTIYAVVKGSAVNNDGNRKVGFTAPSIDGQVEVINMALQKAGITPNTISYVETHGTATKLGDTIEYESLRRVFGGLAESPKYCGLGTVKSNIGHLDTAAGVAGFIKTVLCLKHKKMVPSLYFKKPNPELNFDESALYVNTKLKSWQSSYDGPLRAGVSSFGIGGTNAHIVLEEYDVSSKINSENRPKVIPLSAKTSTALKIQIEDLKICIDNAQDINFDDLAWTLQVGRAEFPHRAAFVAENLNSLSLTLDQANAKGVFGITNETPKKVIFLFPGQGSQYYGMGRDLYNGNAIFKNIMDDCLAKAKLFNGTDYKQILYGKDQDINSINETVHTQPILFMFEYSLASLIMHYGIRPDLMIGHSIGEYVAACISGVMDFESALQLVIHRGEMIQNLPSGSMLSIDKPFKNIENYLPESISIAAINDPGSCTVSGDDSSIESLCDKLEQVGIKYKKLRTSHAFHSKMMKPVEKDFAKLVSKIKLKRPGIPYYSNVTGLLVTEDDVKRPEYWSDQIRRTVKFSQGIQQLKDLDNIVLIEVGAGRTLSHYVRQHGLENLATPVINVVRHPVEEANDHLFFQSCISRIWASGLQVDWQKFSVDYQRKKISLPTYPFDKIEYPIGEDLQTILATHNPGLAIEHKNDISKWFYTESWKQENLILQSNSRKVKGAVIVFKDSIGFYDGQAKTSFSTSEKVITVTMGSTYEKLNGETYTIDPKEKMHYDVLFTDLKKENIHPENVVYFNAMHTGCSEMNHAKIDTSKKDSFFEVLYIAKQLNAFQDASKINFLIVTNGLHQVLGNEYAPPYLSLLPGLITVISQENEKVHCRHIDLQVSQNEVGCNEAIFNELTAEPQDIFVAYRNKSRWIRLYNQRTLQPNPTTSKIKQNGIYLITGGLGKLGFLIANYLRKEYGAIVILTGRTVLDANNADQLQNMRLKSLGDKVRYHSVSVSHKQEMLTVIKKTEAEFGKINGVFHAAGVTSGSSIRRALHFLEKKECLEQFEPKVAGLISLQEVFHEYPLDFFILTSSLSSVIGGKEFGAYAAANCYMDNIAQANYIPNSLSINFDGLDFNQAMKQPSINPDQIIEVIEIGLSLSGISKLIVSVTSLEDRISKWVKLVDAESKNDEKKVVGESFSIDRNVLSSAYSEAETDLEKHIKMMFEDFFGISGVGIDDDFFELGGDSLKAMTLSNSLHKNFNVELELKDFFKNPNIRSLAKEIDFLIEFKLKNQLDVSEAFENEDII